MLNRLQHRQWRVLQLVQNKDSSKIDEDVKSMVQETYVHGSICEGYVTVIFMYTIFTVHNLDRQN